MRKCNQAGINLIQSFEGLRTQAYQDTRGIWTIGYGHTGPDVFKGVIWSVERCNEQFFEDLGRFESGVDGLVNPGVTGNMFSAVVCFSYNVGLGSLRGSSLLKLLNQGDYDGTAAEFVRWDHNHDGTENPGLKRRRLAERTLFLTPDPGTTTTASSSTSLPNQQQG